MMRPLWPVLLAVLSSACLDRELVPLNPCLVSTVSRKVTVTSINKVDLLFMVDNSASMTSKQDSLKAQFPRMIQVLSTGMRSANDPSPFPAVADMHLAVVSSDMGVTGQTGIMGCDPNGGDDGRLKHDSSGDPGCQATYPPFLSYDATRDDPMQIGVDFGCIASLGAMGCTYESQLEAALKALWPSVALGADGNILSPNPIAFLGPAGFTTGRGDLAPPEGSIGFMRDNPADPAVLAIVLLTDEDDQSSASTEYLSTTHASAMQPAQVRPAMNAQFLHPVSRYIDGFKALRPNAPQLIVFAAIAGVPTDLVDERARANVDFSDEGQRTSYYDRIANDRRMQPNVQNVFGLGMSFAPACQRRNAMRDVETATPARRILDVVRGFGENGTLQSICADDYGPGMDAIIDIIARQLGAVCLPRPLIRTADGLVACDVVWELPRVGTAAPGTPVSCTDLPFLKPVDPGRPSINAQGGVNCKIEQLPILGAEVVPTAPGWFYDSFSPGVVEACPSDRQQRVSFTESARPANGVSVKLECLNEVQSQPQLRSDISTQAPQPTIGSACSGTTTVQPAPETGRTTRRSTTRQSTTSSAAVSGPCTIQLQGGGADNSMFCHPDLNVCVQGCSTSDDCPAAWVCDQRDETIEMTNGRSYCSNPTCGGG